MKYLEIRRHSIRVKPSKHINQEGVNLARSIGQTIGQCYLVITSTSPRAIDTAIAMGYAVDEQYDELLINLDEDATKELKGVANFIDFYEIVMKKNSAISKIADIQTKLYKRIANKLPENEKALIISHGGQIESAITLCVPNIDYKSWGHGLNCCEGVLLSYNEEKFVNAKILRIEK